MSNQISPVSHKLSLDSDVKSKPQAHSHLFTQHGIRLNTDGIDAEIRHDYLHDNLVIVAPNRSHRPYDTKDKGHLLIETRTSPRLDDQPAIYTLKHPNGKDWYVKVVENKFPSLTVDNPRAYGKQEIVIDTPRAAVAFAHLTVEQILRVLEVYQLRTAALMNQNDVEYVLVFKNDGYGAGASLAHAHSQIFALPLVPQKYQREAELTQAYHTENKRNAYDDIIAYEQKSKKRIIAETKHFLVFCPYASQWPFEFWLMPKRQFSMSTQINQEELAEIAQLLKKYLSKLNKHAISYNLYLENGVSSDQRFCIKVCGRSNIWGGLEVATGIVINTIPPESAAQWYRQ